MYYLLLILLVFIVLFIFYNIFKRDILSPTIISCFAFIISIGCAWLGLASWNSISNLTDEVYLIFFLGLLSFGLGEVIARITHRDSGKNNYKFKSIYVERWKIVIMALLIIITILSMYIDIKRICGYFGFSSSNISSLIAFYRTKSALFSTELISSGINISFISNQLLKVSNIFCIISIFCLLNNLILGEKLKNNIKYFIPIVLTCILSLFTSGRGLLMRYIVCAFIIWTILYRNYNYNKLPNSSYEKKSKLTIKIVKTGIICLLFAFIVFYLILPLVGRNTNIVFLDYITFYFGSPIPSLDIFLSSQHYNSGIFGEETLVGIYGILNKIGITNFVQQTSREFISFGGMNSNIYTGFRRYYFDFGMIGVIICQWLFGFVFTKIYLFSSKNGNIKWLLFYGYMASILIDQIRDEAFFVTFVSSSTLTYAILIYIIYYFIFKFKIRVR